VFNAYNSNGVNRWKPVLTIFVLGLLLLIYFKSGLWEKVSVQNLRDLGNNPYAPLLIIAAMTIVWTFPLPASIFFFITPLLYPPVESTVIIIAGSMLGSTSGYIAARNISSNYADKYRSNKITQFLKRHSTFGSIFALRIVPSSPHFLINYVAGILKIPIRIFLTATFIAIGIKGYLYSSAVNSGIGARSLSEALGINTILPLFALAALAILGKILKDKIDNNFQKRE
jgi:uncharacterized membrane protein YdjX (TVP38/TMEM64 family)